MSEVLTIVRSKESYDLFVNSALSSKKIHPSCKAKIGKAELCVKFTDMGKGPYMSDFYHWHVLMKLFCSGVQVDERFSFISDENENLICDDIFWTYEELLEIIKEDL